MSAPSDCPHCGGRLQISKDGNLARCRECKARVRLSGTTSGSTGSQRRKIPSAPPRVTGVSRRKKRGRSDREPAQSESAGIFADYWPWWAVGGGGVLLLVIGVVALSVIGSSSNPKADEHAASGAEPAQPPGSATPATSFAQFVQCFEPAVNRSSGRRLGVDGGATNDQWWVRVTNFPEGRIEWEGTYQGSAYTQFHVALILNIEFPGATLPEPCRIQFVTDPAMATEWNKVPIGGQVRFTGTLSGAATVYYYNSRGDIQGTAFDEYIKANAVPYSNGGFLIPGFGNFTAVPPDSLYLDLQVSSVTPTDYDASPSEEGRFDGKG